MLLPGYPGPPPRGSLKLERKQAKPENMQHRTVSPYPRSPASFKRGACSLPQNVTAAVKNESGEIGERDVRAGAQAGDVRGLSFRRKYHLSGPPSTLESARDTIHFVHSSSSVAQSASSLRRAFVVPEAPQNSENSFGNSPGGRGYQDSAELPILGVVPFGCIFADGAQPHGSSHVQSLPATCGCALP